MIRPKVFHGTYSTTCANRVLPTFMRHLGLFKPGSFANDEFGIQIVDTPESLETLVSMGWAGFEYEINRTLLIQLQPSTQGQNNDSISRSTSVRLRRRDLLDVFRGGLCIT